MSSDNYKYYEVAERIRKHIKDNMLNAGSRLPGIRIFAKEYDVSKNTVIKALEYLSDLKLVELKEKHGAYVTWQAWIGEANDDFWYRFSAYDSYTDTNLNLMKHVNSVSSDKISTGTAMFSEEFNADTYLSYAVKDLYRRIIDEKLANRLAEVPKVKEAICRHLMTKGIVAEPENILLTNGVRHGVAISLMTLLSKNATLITEKPTGVDGAHYASMAGARHLPVEMDNEGIDVSKIKQIRHRNRAVLLTSTIHQYPTGIDMSKRRKLELLDTCKELQIPIIEMDFFSDCIHGELLRAIDENTVIYCGTIRHTFSLGLNVGWVVVPKCMMAKFTTMLIKNHMYRDTITHTILESLLSNGYYYSFLRHSASLVKDRVELTNTLLKEHLHPYVTWEEKNSKILYWLNFNDIDVKSLFEKLPNIISAQGSIFDSDYKNYLSFCPMSLKEDELQYFVHSISSKIREVSLS